MKHLLNNLSIEEKNRIREQHEGGMSVNTSKFKKLIESKSGNVKPLIMERGTQSPAVQTAEKVSLPPESQSQVLDTGLQIDCVKRVITKANIHLIKDANTKIIDIYCNMANRNTSKIPSN